jgi:hypothetical protein
VRYFFYILLILSFSLQTNAQIPAIELMGERDHVKIPFSFYYNFIIVDIVLDGIIPLKFILDTGAENTIIFEKIYGDLVGLEYEREISIMGSDFSSEVKALIARRVFFDLPRVGKTHSDIIVLKENHYHLEQFIGANIHGILGSNVFNGLVMEIDFDKEHLKIFKPERYTTPKKATRIPLTINSGKPYINAYTKCGNPIGDELTYLLDTGAGISTMLHNNTHNLVEIPENVISGHLGSGLGGSIVGYIGRVEELDIGPYHFQNLISAFQELDTIYLHNADITRNGIIGNQILSRFDITIDYAHQSLYLHPNSTYDKEFQVDRSGIYLVASGAHLMDFYIQQVVENSPAHQAGLMSGDNIVSINGLRASLFSMNWLARKFQGKKGKHIKLKIIRDGVKMKFDFYLNDLI